MKEGKIKNIVDREVKQLHWMLKNGQIDPKFVTLALFIEGVIEDFHVPEADHDLLKSMIVDALASKNIVLIEE